MYDVKPGFDTQTLRFTASIVARKSGCAVITVYDARSQVDATCKASKLLAALAPTMFRNF